MGVADFAGKATFDATPSVLTISIPKTMRPRLVTILEVAAKKHEGFVRFRIENLEKPKTLPQLKRTFAILRKIYYAIGGDKWGFSEAKGMEKLMEGILHLACKEFGYPYVMAGSILIPKSLSSATSFEIDLVMQTEEQFAAVHGIDITRESDTSAGF